MGGTNGFRKNGPRWESEGAAGRPRQTEKQENTRKKGHVTFGKSHNQ